MFTELIKELEENTEKAFEELEESKRNFFRGHEERMSILRDCFSKVGSKNIFDFDEKYEEVENDNIMEDLDQIDKDLDELLTSM